MGAIFYRGIDPSNMGYADLRYYNEWHTAIADAEVKAANGGK